MLSAREWKPGDVAVVRYPIWGAGGRDTTYEDVQVARFDTGWSRLDDPDDFVLDDNQTQHFEPRPLVVIDPEDEHSRAAIEITQRIGSSLHYAPGSDLSHIRRAVNDALRVLAMAPKPEEPTDPRVRVTDRRDNIWRLLADGDWVCTSGPDIGEYLTWGGLTERGPLEVQP